MAEGFLARVRAQAPSLGRAEQAVARVILERPDEIIEWSSSQLAETAGTSRPTVVRTCQSLGLTGYQQLRVLLAREGVAAPVGPSSTASSPTGSGPRALVEASFRHVGANVEQMTALLTDEDVEAAVSALADARRLVIVGHGVSASLASDVAARLVTLGRVSERYGDVIEERIAIGGLGEDDVVLIVSGSGSNTLSLAAARTARDAGATVVVVTAFSHSPVVELASVSLVTGMPQPSFREEILTTSRIPQTILLEAVVGIVATRLDEAGREAKMRAVDIVSDYVEE